MVHKWLTPSYNCRMYLVFPFSVFWGFAFVFSSSGCSLERMIACRHCPVPLCQVCSFYMKMEMIKKYLDLLMQYCWYRNCHMIDLIQMEAENISTFNKFVILFPFRWAAHLSILPPRPSKRLPEVNKFWSLGISHAHNDEQTLPTLITMIKNKRIWDWCWIKVENSYQQKSNLTSW